MRTKASLFPNPNFETKQIRTWCMGNKNPMRFYLKKEIKEKQGYDKKLYPKQMFNILKGNEEFYLYL